MPDPKICEEGGKGIVLPLIPGENKWDKAARGFMYFMVLSWCFYGVAIISDIFMESIEAVTSKRREWKLKNGQVVTTKAWNETVANLTLMALGSSAPEITLNVIEIVGRDYFSGDLGPSTIVGSAAFNLMVIISVCVYVIPDGESRTIESLEPFLVTAVSSIWAYLWMVVVLSISSPNIVTVPEAVVTFLFFPLLVILAYLADIGVFSRRKDDDASQEMEHIQFIKDKVLEAGYELTTEETQMLAKMKSAQLGGRSRAASRVSASPLLPKGITAKELSVRFLSNKYSFPSGANSVTLMVEKFGENPTYVRDARVGFEYKTVDGALRCDAGDYNYAEGYGEISSGSMCGEILVTRKAAMKLNGTQNKPPKKAANGRTSVLGADTFSVQLTQAYKQSVRDSRASMKRKSKSLSGDEQRLTLTGQEGGIEQNARIPINIAADGCRTQVGVSESSGVGLLRMHTDEVDVACPDADSVVKIKVHRDEGVEGDISCMYSTEDDIAKAGIHYMAVEGELHFPTGAVEKMIEVPLLKKVDTQSQEKFSVVLSNLPGRRTSIVEEMKRCTVTIHDDSAEGIASSNKVLKALEGTLGSSFVNSGREWADQFAAAMNPRGGDEESAEQATATEWTSHLLALPWKLLFACTPPPSYCGGWGCFTVALCFIFVITVFISDLATLLGCVMDIDGSITAITIVALGTSLPDTFASKVAAVEEPTADAAIGNVTGSNSVNVFLGLGVPWMIGSIYWEKNGKNSSWIERYPEQDKEYDQLPGLVVLAQDLSFSVAIFTVCALVTLGVIWYRRSMFQAELGGPAGVKINTSIFLVLLWCFYVAMACWKVIGGDSVTTEAMVVAVIVGLLLVVIGMIIVGGTITFFKSSSARRRQEIKEALQEFQDEGGNSVRRSSSKVGGHRLSGSGSFASHLDEDKAIAVQPTSRTTKGARTTTSVEELLASAPSLAEGLRLKLPEAVANLREHLEALNEVCVSLENQMNGNGPEEAQAKVDAKAKASRPIIRKPQASSSGAPRSYEEEVDLVDPDVVGKLLQDRSTKSRVVKRIKHPESNLEDSILDTSDREGVHDKLIPPVRKITRKSSANTTVVKKRVRKLPNGAHTRQSSVLMDDDLDSLLEPAIIDPNRSEDSGLLGN